MLCDTPLLCVLRHVPLAIGSGDELSRAVYALALRRLVSLLLEAGANVSSISRADGSTPLHLAMRLSPPELGLTNADDEILAAGQPRHGAAASVIRQLVDAGSDVFAAQLVDVYFHTPLHEARSPHAVFELLDACSMRTRIHSRGTKRNYTDWGEKTV